MSVNGTIRTCPNTQCYFLNFQVTKSIAKSITSLPSVSQILKATIKLYRNYWQLKISNFKIKH
ncbi:MAG TPA: hypothetical protein DCQ31_13535 [Bacteroidales bacterium]|nr:hypothetical protein [Bacteroidales bacterium]